LEEDINFDLKEMNGHYVLDSEGSGEQWQQVLNAVITFGPIPVAVLSKE
jgi:hypothetical protein